MFGYVKQYKCTSMHSKISMMNVITDGVFLLP